jgi:hypothetical protein
LVVPEGVPAPPGHAQGRVADVNTDDASSIPLLRWTVRHLKASRSACSEEREMHERAYLARHPTLIATDIKHACIYEELIMMR